MSIFSQKERSFFTDIHLLNANSIYLNKVYAQEKDKAKKNKKQPNTFWNAIDIENIMKPINKSFEKKTLNSTNKINSPSNSSEKCSHSSNKSSQSSKKSSQSSKKSSHSSKKYSNSSKSPEIIKKEPLKKQMKKKVKSSKNKNSKEKMIKKENIEDLSIFFDEKKSSKQQNIKENDDSFALMNKTIDGFEKTLQDFFDEKKEKKITKTSSSKSLENLKNLQKSLALIEEDMDKKLKVMQPKKTTVEILAENIEKQQIFMSNDDIYEISFQQKN